MSPGDGTAEDFFLTHNVAVSCPCLIHFSAASWPHLDEVQSPYDGLTTFLGLPGALIPPEPDSGVLAHRPYSVLRLSLSLTTHTVLSTEPPDFALLFSLPGVTPSSPQCHPHRFASVTKLICISPSVFIFSFAFSGKCFLSSHIVSSAPTAPCAHSAKSACDSLCRLLPSNLGLLEGQNTSLLTVLSDSP